MNGIKRAKRVQYWVNVLYVFLPIIFFTGCASLPKTLAEKGQAQTYGYTPFDPLPVTVTNIVAADITNAQITLRALPDETMRLAVGQISGSGNISYGPASIGYAGSNYVVVLDYMKYNTLSLQLFEWSEGSASNIIYFSPISFTNVDGTEAFPAKIMPIYVGVALRITANIKVNSGSVSLGNLIAIGAAADTKAISGTLVIQTLGISGQSVSSTIPIPNDVNGTTIANALMALGTIKSKFYDNSGDISIKPQVLGVFYNIEKGKGTVNDVVSWLLAKPPILNTSIGTGGKLLP